MVVGLGIDVTELDRIERAWQRYGERFARRVLTDYEREGLPARHPVPFLAARFAAKEAAAKALGTGFRQGVHLRLLEVRPLPSGKPEMAFYGAAIHVCRELGVTHSQVSLTHGRDVAAAVVVLERNP
jgi:holo-[acyl-carrier protein] synthase